MHKGPKAGIEGTSAIVWLIELEEASYKVVMNPISGSGKPIILSSFQLIHLSSNLLGIITLSVENRRSHNGSFWYVRPEKLVDSRIGTTIPKSLLNILAKLLGKCSFFENLTR